MRTLQLSLTAYFVLAIASCSSSSSPNNLLLGKWESVEESDEKIEFSKDGQFVIYFASYPKETAVTGKFKFIDDNNVEFTINGVTSGEIISPGFMQMNFENLKAILAGKQVVVTAKIVVTKNEITLSVGSAELWKYRRAG